MIHLVSPSMTGITRIYTCGIISVLSLNISVNMRCWDDGFRTTMNPFAGELKESEAGFGQRLDHND